MAGGIANAGAVTRDGDHVLRPSNPHTATIHAFLRFLRERGLRPAPATRSASTRTGASGSSTSPATSPCRRTRRGRRPTWRWPRPPRCCAACTTSAPATCRRPTPRGATRWPIPGRRRRDLPQRRVPREPRLPRPGRGRAARLRLRGTRPARPRPRRVRPDERPDGHRRRCRAARPQPPFDPFRRLRIVADAYGLPPDRREFLDALADGVDRGGQFLQRRLDEGNEAFRQMVADDAAGWPSSTAAGRGSRPTASASPTPSADRHTPLAPRGQTAPMSVRIVHVSDSHLGPGVPYADEHWDTRRRPRRDGAARPRRAHRRHQPRRGSRPRRPGPQPRAPRDAPGAMAGAARQP